MSSVNKDICFHSIVHTLISFSLLITIILLGILSMMLKRSDGARSILALYLSLQKSFKFLTINMKLVVGLLVDILYEFEDHLEFLE